MLGALSVEHLRVDEPAAGLSILAFLLFAHGSSRRMTELATRSERAPLTRWSRVPDRGRVRYHLFVCHGSSLSEAAPPLDQLARWSAPEQLPDDRGGGDEALLIKMRPARVEKLLPRLLDPSG
jgi:hypothetical protein